MTVYRLLADLPTYRTTNEITRLLYELKIFERLSPCLTVSDMVFSGNVCFSIFVFH